MRCGLCQDSSIVVWNTELLGKPPADYVLLPKDPSSKMQHLVELVCPFCTNGTERSEVSVEPRAALVAA